MDISQNWLGDSIAWPANDDPAIDTDYETDEEIDPAVKRIHHAIDEQVNITAAVKAHASQMEEEEARYKASLPAAIEDSEKETIRKAEEAFRSAEEALNQARKSLAQAEAAFKETKSEFVLKRQQYENQVAKKKKPTDDQEQDNGDSVGISHVADIFVNSSKQLSEFMVCPSQQ